MISSINLSAYQRIAIMTANLNGFISDAAIAKTQIVRDFRLAMLNEMGIAQRVNIQA